VRAREDKRDLLSDGLPFGRLWYGEPNAISDEIGYAKFYGRSYDAVIRVYDEGATGVRRTSSPARSQSRKNSLDLWGEGIDYCVHGSSCALHNAVPYILGRLHSAVRHVGCRADGASLNAAKGHGYRKND
jgi:hypothetical protein